MRRFVHSVLVFTLGLPCLTLRNHRRTVCIAIERDFLGGGIAHRTAVSTPYSKMAILVWAAPTVFRVQKGVLERPIRCG